MLKKLLIVLSIIIISFSFVGCGKTYEEATEQPLHDDFANGYFTELYNWEANDDLEEYHIVYANDTKVKYLVIVKSRRFGITPLYNADGTLQVYEGE